MERVVKITQEDVNRVLADPLVTAQVRLTAMARELQAAYERCDALEAQLAAEKKEEDAHV